MTEAEQASPSGPCFRLLYRSHSRIPADERKHALAEIFNEARHNNRAHGVTGALLMTDHYFVQALEGDEKVVQSLYDRIAKDDRHDQLTLLESSGVDHRAFGRWSMAQISPSGRGDIPLHTTGDSISRAAPSPVTREQNAVLRIMRNAIGADTV